MFVCVRGKGGRGVGRTVVMLQVCVPVLVVPPQMQRPQQLRQMLHSPQNSFFSAVQKPSASPVLPSVFSTLCTQAL